MKDRTQHHAACPPFSRVCMVILLLVALAPCADTLAAESAPRGDPLTGAHGGGSDRSVPEDPFPDGIASHDALVQHFRQTYDWRTLHLLLARAGHPKPPTESKSIASRFQAEPRAIQPMFQRLGILRNDEAFRNVHTREWQNLVGKTALVHRHDDALFLGTKENADLIHTLVFYLDIILEAYHELCPFPAPREGTFLVKLYPDQATYDQQDYRPNSNATFRPHAYFLAMWVDTDLAEKDRPATTEKLLRILFHEVWHLYLLYHVPNPPIWLNEGVAEVMEGSEFRGETLRIGAQAVHAENLQVLRHFLKRKEAHPLKAFVRMDKQEFDKTPEISYTQAWGWMHYLLYADNGAHRHRYATILRLLRTGQSEADAVAEAFSDMDWDATETAWRTYIRKLKAPKGAGDIRLQPAPNRSKSP